jgi:hypothetical protein
MSDEGPESLKWETGICLFFTAKMGFHALRLGYMGNKAIQNGIMIIISMQDSHWDETWDLCSWTLGFS